MFCEPLKVDSGQTEKKQQVSYNIKKLDFEQNLNKWNKFVDCCEQASFFHKAEWAKILDQAFGHETYYYYAERAGEIKAILPLVHIQSRLFGSFLSSTPFCIYGGPAYIEKDAALDLIDYAVTLAQDLEVDYVELRTTKAFPNIGKVKDLYSTFQMPIISNPEAIIKSIKPRKRTMIRKSFKMGLVSAIDQNVDDFYTIYSTSVRNLGTPVFSKQYFEILIETFGEQCEIFTVRRAGKPLSTAMSFYYNDTVYPYYVGGNKEARRSLSNYYMLYELMCHAAIERCCTTFDFGRSKKGTGAWDFKKHLGLQEKDLQYQYFCINQANLPDLSPKNPKYQLMIQAWKKLPLKLTQLLGPYISKYLG